MTNHIDSDHAQVITEMEKKKKKELKKRKKNLKKMLARWEDKQYPFKCVVWVLTEVMSLACSLCVFCTD